jgi:ABC-type antimicrobial peptide transport system permease subunit
MQFCSFHETPAKLLFQSIEAFGAYPLIVLPMLVIAGHGIAFVQYVRYVALGEFGPTSGAVIGIFGVLALVLASVGIYGTLAYSVARRTNEIGIRMAIGAQRRNVIWMVLRDSLVLISAGIILGLPLALGGTRWLSSFLFGVQRVDPLAIGSAVLLIFVMALLAGYLPARRAAKIDPMRALRHE